MSSFDKKLAWVAALGILAWAILHVVTQKTKNLSAPDPTSGAI